MFLPDSFVHELSLFTKRADAVLGYKSNSIPAHSSSLGSKIKPKGTNYSMTNASAPVAANGVANNTKAVPPPTIRR